MSGAPDYKQQQVIVSDTADIDLSSQGEMLLSAGYAFSPWDKGRLSIGIAKEIQSGRSGLSFHLKTNL